MYNPDKPYELRNIKKNPSGYQVQFIVKGKSHSVLEKDLEKAKKIRDKMEKKFKGSTNKVYQYLPLDKKMSFIPGTNKPMPVGITLHIYQNKGTETYSIQVRWRDNTGHWRIKTFYGCSAPTYSLKKMKEAYKLAYKFRQAYMEAVTSKTLDQFEPTSFNRSRKKKTIADKVKQNTLLRKKMRRR